MSGERDEFEGSERGGIGEMGVRVGNFKAEEWNGWQNETEARVSSEKKEKEGNENC